MTIFDTAAHEVVSRRSSEKMAVPSIDVEHDCNGDRTGALDRLPDLLDALRRFRLPLTVVDAVSQASRSRAASPAVVPSHPY